MKRPARLALQRRGGITAQGGKAAAKAGLQGWGSVRAESHLGHLPLYLSSQPQQGSAGSIKSQADAAQGYSGQSERGGQNEGREYGADVEGAHSGLRFLTGLGLLGPYLSKNISRDKIGPLHHSVLAKKRH